MATGTITLTAPISGLPSGSKSVTPTIINLAAAVGQITDVNLASGDNTITVPSGSTMAVIVFPVTAATVKLRAGGTTGAQDLTLIINPAVVLWSAFTVSTMASFILNASAIVNGVEISFL